jgi:hypothetical protein
VKLRELAQEYLRLAADPAPHLEEATVSAKRQPVVDHRLEETRLAVEAFPLLRSVSVEVALIGAHEREDGMPERSTPYAP